MAKKDNISEIKRIVNAFGNKIAWNEIFLNDWGLTPPVVPSKDPKYDYTAYAFQGGVRVEKNDVVVYANGERIVMKEENSESLYQFLSDYNTLFSREWEGQDFFTMD